jgi:hypothetical protein
MARFLQLVEVSMDRREDENPYEESWLPPFPSEADIPAMRVWPRRRRSSPHLQIHNGVETRRFLAEEVYRVPDAFLDDVIRIRMADLDR